MIKGNWFKMYSVVYGFIWHTHREGVWQGVYVREKGVWQPWWGVCVGMCEREWCLKTLVWMGGCCLCDRLDVQTLKLFLVTAGERGHTIFNNYFLWWWLTCGMAWHGMSEWKQSDEKSGFCRHHLLQQDFFFFLGLSSLSSSISIFWGVHHTFVVVLLCLFDFFLSFLSFNF